MKVDLVFSGFLSAPNGVSTFLNTFKNGVSFFEKENVNLNIYSADCFAKRDFEQRGKGIKSKLKLIVKKLISKSSFFTVRFIKKSEQNNQAIVDYYLSKKNRDPDVVFFHELTTCYYYLQQRRNKKAKVVLVLHTNGDTFKMLRIYYPKLMKTSYYKHLLNIESYVLNNIDNVGFVAKKALENFRELNPELDVSKSFYVLNGIGNKTKNRLSSNKEDIYSFCCVGSITNRKGQELLIKTFEKLKIEDKNKFNFVFLGEGEDKDRLKAYVNKQNLNHFFEFKGAVNNVDEYLQRCNGFILTSYDEGLPISIIEALRFGLPIVSTNVGGVSEMVEDKKNGFLIEPNEKELLDVFRNIDNYDLKVFGEESSKIYLNKFTENQMFNGYLNIFKKQ